MKISNSLPQFKTDYWISWDFNETDRPYLIIAKVECDGDGTLVRADSIGQTFANSGCVSLRQAIEEYEERQRKEKEHKEKRHEFIEKAFNLPKQNIVPLKDDQTEEAKK